MRNAVAGAVVAALLAALTASAVASGGARDARRHAPGPSLSLSAPAQADVGQSFSVSYTARRLPRTARLWLQRQEGTARAWRGVVRLQRSGTSAQLSVPLLGRARLRVAAVVGRRALAASRVRMVDVFGTVSLATLVGHSGPPTAFVIGDHTFNSVYGTNPSSIFWSTSSPNQLFSQNVSTCRSLHLDLASEAQSADFVSPVSTDSVTVTQQTADPVTVAVAPNTVAALDVTLTPGQSWAATASGTYPLHMNGQASCDATERFILPG